MGAAPPGVPVMGRVSAGWWVRSVWGRSEELRVENWELRKALEIRDLRFQRGAGKRRMKAVLLREAALRYAAREG